MTNRTFPALADRLDRAEQPVTLFFRDDDAGWADRELLALCDRFRARAPLDLAVIPCAIKSATAAALIHRAAELCFHQHGYAHQNHQVTGRKGEFSDERAQSLMAEEIRAGRRRLLELFGVRLDPIFTPPWNRCGRAAAVALGHAGLRVLSRDRGAGRFDLPGLVELPIDVDWVRRRSELDRCLADAVGPDPVGVMLHHQMMDSADLERLDALLDLLAGHPRVRLETMMTAAGMAPTAQTAMADETPSGPGVLS